MEQATPTTVKAFEFFKPGTFTDVSGKTYTFNAAAVRELVDGYNTDISDAPFVVGHPKLTSPRFGRAGRLYVNDKGVAMCEGDSVVAEFAEMVNKGLYPKVSASIFLPNAKGNPTPGKHYLNHIGFLGGVAPAVKGLEMVQFAGDDDGVASFAYEDRTQAGLFRGLRNWMLAKFGQDDADAALPEWDVQYMADQAAQPDAADKAAEAAALPYPSSSFSTATKPTEITTMDANKEARLAALEAREAEITAREAALASQANIAARTEVASFAEGLIAAGKLLPANKNAVVEVLTQLSTVDAQHAVASFAAADPAHADHGKTGAQLLRDMLSALPVQVSFSKLPAGANAGVANFAAPEGATADPAGLELMARAQAYQKDHAGMSLIDAAVAVQKLG